MPPPAVKPGEVYGRLTILEEMGRTPNRNRIYLCQCSCGRQAQINSSSIRSGKTSSCGCLRLEATACKGRATRTHGESHSATPEYRAWSGMKARCYTPTNKDFSKYGGRGIAVCSQWLQSYETFLNDVGRRPSSCHSLDRIDVEGDYTPSNIRWATPKEQSRNKRTNILIEAFNKVQTISAWAEETGLKDVTIRQRLLLGWDPEESVSVLPRQRRKIKPND